MIKNLIVTLAVFVSYHNISAQKASDVLENGIHVKAGQKIFLQYTNGILMYDATRSLTDEVHPPDFISLDDSLIFLLNKSAVNVYLTPPLNPVNFSFNTESKEILDPINVAATNSMGSIIEVLHSKIQTPGPHAANSTKCDTLFEFLDSCVVRIQRKLNDNQQTDINKAFTAFKSLSFNDEKKTIDSIVIIKKWMDNIEKHFTDLESDIKNANDALKKYDCGTTDMAFTIKYIFTNIFKEAIELETEQKKRFENLLTVSNLVEKTQQDASQGVTGLKWCIKLLSIPSIEGKIYLFTVTVKESGYHLSDKKEIVNIETKDALKKTLRIRKFQRFVPEVSVGTVYTFFKYNTYGTTSDSAGLKTTNVFIASPTENLVRNINITTMINFNYYIPNSPIHPFYQLGVGINSGVPSIITGFGLRSNINGFKRLAFSGGIAVTWLPELDKLKVGDKISGTADIDNDIKYKFTNPTPYIGIQYNF